MRLGRVLVLVLFLVPVTPVHGHVLAVLGHPWRAPALPGPVPVAPPRCAVLPS